jgi:hypothetical protein
MEFVLSFVGIKDKDAIPLTTVDQSDVGQASTQPPDGISIVDSGNDKSTWSEVVSIGAASISKVGGHKLS